MSHPTGLPNKAKIPPPCLGAVGRLNRFDYDFLPFRHFLGEILYHWFQQRSFAVFFGFRKQFLQGLWRQFIPAQPRRIFPVLELDHHPVVRDRFGCADDLRSVRQWKRAALATVAIRAVEKIRVKTNLRIYACSNNRGPPAMKAICGLPSGEAKALPPSRVLFFPAIAPNPPPSS